jgi:hypothetical protein
VKKPATKDKVNKVICCMNVKKETSTTNLFGVFFIYSALGCATGLLNSKIVGLLTSEAYLLEEVQTQAWEFDSTRDKK